MIHGGDMNERIKELAEQATLAVTKPDGHYIVQAWQPMPSQVANHQNN